MKKIKKVSEKELMIRKFRKFLYDNDALESWYKYNKTKGLGHSLHNLFNEQVPSKWFTYAFGWSNTPEGNDYWCTLAIKWDEESAK